MLLNMQLELGLELCTIFYLSVLWLYLPIFDHAFYDSDHLYYDIISSIKYMYHVKLESKRKF